MKADDFAKHVNDLSAFKAEQDIRAQAIPASPDKYEIALPEGFTPPAGYEFKLDPNDPDLAEARKFAHEAKLDQAGFQRMLGVYAANKIGELQRTTAAREAEMAKLGTTGPARLDAIETWMKAKVGDKASILINTLKQYPVAATVEALEGVIRAFSSQGGTNFSQQHREQSDPKPSNEEFSSWSYAEQREYQSSGKRPQRAA